MTRAEGTEIIYKVINSGIIAEEVEEELSELANAICSDDFEQCEPQEGGTLYCDGCRFQGREN